MGWPEYAMHMRGNSINDQYHMDLILAHSLMLSRSSWAPFWQLPHVSRYCQQGIIHYFIKARLQITAVRTFQNDQRGFHALWFVRKGTWKVIFKLFLFGNIRYLERLKIFRMLLLFMFSTVLFFLSKTPLFMYEWDKWKILQTKGNASWQRWQCFCSCWIGLNCISFAMQI